jgi:hypothetical protein
MEPSVYDRNTSIISQLFESKTGYIVKLKSAFVNETDYRLYQSKDGHWPQDVDGEVALNEPIALAIRKAIEDHEKT